MHRNFIRFLGGAASAAILLLVLYFLPPIHARLAWRIDFATTYVLSALHPAGDLPTPLPVATSTPGPTRTATGLPTPLPTPSTPEPTQAPTPTLAPPPAQAVVAAPKWEEQGINNCGPTTLSMYLRFYGWEGDQYAITEVIKPKPEDRNVNVEELAYFTRTHVGWLNYEYRLGMDLESIKRVVAAGIPAMIEETFMMNESYWPNDDRWAGHYLLITGYDDPAGVFTTQDSFVGANRKVAYKDLDQNWKAFNRVLILVYPPEMQDTIKTILGADWDVDANRANALRRAQAETQANPKDAFAWFNVGTNLTYFERYSEAGDAYDQARSLGLPQRMLRYQFGPFIAYFHTGRMEDLRALTDYALQRTRNSEEALLWQGWMLYRQGDRVGAEADFKKALEENSSYQDARYALDFLSNN